MVIYVRDNIISYLCDVLDNLPFEESVWRIVKVNRTDNLLIGGIYRSAAKDSSNNENLLHLISTACAKNFKYVLVAGDFNYPKISWDTWSTSRIKTLSNFWNVYVTFIFFRLLINLQDLGKGQICNILDLFLCSTEDMINVQYGDHLGASDHIQ